MIWCGVNVGKRAFIAGVGDDQGYGWAIAKALAAAGAEILVGTWVPVCVSIIYVHTSNPIRRMYVCPCLKDSVLFV
jgi:enoyl-[acyl-carrier-protein] reductase (NADH)